MKVNINQGRTGDSLCTQCHSEPRAGLGAPGSGLRELKPSSLQVLKPSFAGAGLEQHTFHKPDSAGSRCISCHMSDVNWRLLIRRRDHTFQPPVPENTAQFGVPNACTTCHDNRSPEWAAKQMDEWWGDGSRRAKSVGVAETMYRAGSGDVTVIPALAVLGVDRNEGLTIRASAVDYIGRMLSASRTRGVAGDGPQQSQTSFGSSSDLNRRLPSTGVIPIAPLTVNRLIGAASDPEPAVRAVAVRALGATGLREEKVLAVITARLTDDARIVRVRTAEVLLSYGIAEFPGRAGTLLSRAQEEYRTSLQSFPDRAANHTELGWLASELGDTAAANASLNDALAFSPHSARPYVLKGVLFARDGRFADAVEIWKKARSIEPSYPNIDQLIAEAEKRKQ